METLRSAGFTIERRCAEDTFKEVKEQRKLKRDKNYTANMLEKAQKDNDEDKKKKYHDKLKDLNSKIKEGEKKAPGIISSNFEEKDGKLKYRIEANLQQISGSTMISTELTAETLQTKHSDVLTYIDDKMFIYKNKCYFGQANY